MKRGDDHSGDAWGEDTSFRFSNDIYQNRLVDSEYMHGKPLDAQFFEQSREEEEQHGHTYRSHQTEEKIKPIVEEEIDEEESEEEEENIFEMIHPASEGIASHQYTDGEPEYQTLQGHKFAMLDWGQVDDQPAEAQEDDQEEEDDPEVTMAAEADEEKDYG